MKRIVLSALLIGLIPVIEMGAASFEFDLSGTAGAGLLPGNETHIVTGGGTGGEIGGGITLDSDTNQLTINIGWGSGSGFVDLSGDATAAHIHGATASSGANGFTETAGVLVNLSGILTVSASSGGLSGAIVLTDAAETDILAGRTYINIHTLTNGGGEIRGQLIAVPEPGTYALVFGLGCGVFTFFRRSRNQ